MGAQLAFPSSPPYPTRLPTTDEREEGAMAVAAVARQGAEEVDKARICAHIAHVGS